MPGRVAAAARYAGLTPTGYCAQAAVNTARDQLTNTAKHVDHQALGSLQAELFQARIAVNQLSTELHSTRNDSRATTDDLDKLIARAADVLAELDNAASRIHRQLRR